MIVTCEKCNTSFDLDDELIEESGSEVKCSECQHVFTVHQSAPDEEPELSLDLESDAADSSQAEEEFDIEALGLDEELDVGGPVEIKEEAAVEGTPKPMEEAASEELDLEAISRAVEEAAEEPEGVSEETPSEDEVLDFDLLDAEEGADAEEAAGKDIEFDGIGLEEEPADEPPEPVVDEGLEREVEAEEEAPEEPVEEEWVPPPVASKAPPAQKRVSSPMMIVMVLILLAGGALGGYAIWRGKIPSIPHLTDAERPSIADPGNLRIAVPEDQAEFVETGKAGRVFVIKGMVRNDYGEARNFIRVKGVLYSKDGKPVQTKTSFCGNVLSDSQLQTLDEASLQMRLQNRFGDQRSNFQVPSGKTVPFMLIFFDLSQDLGEYSVQVVSSDQAQ